MANKENLKKWVDALRSGNYQQGIGFLQTFDDKYCCLGVLCRVAMDNGVEIEVTPQFGNPLGPISGFYAFDGCTAYLPEKASIWAFNTHDVNVNPKIGEVNASWLNDGDRLSFAEIADRIESEFRLTED